MAEANTSDQQEQCDDSPCRSPKDVADELPYREEPGYSAPVYFAMLLSVVAIILAVGVAAVVAWVALSIPGG